MSTLGNTWGLSQKLAKTGGIFFKVWWVHFIMFSAQNVSLTKLTSSHQMLIGLSEVDLTKIFLSTEFMKHPTSVNIHVYNTMVNQYGRIDISATCVFLDEFY